MMAVAKKAAGEFSGGVIGVGDDGDSFPPRESQEELAQFIEQGTPIPVGPDQAFVDAGGNGDAQADAGYLDQQGNGLTGMAHDERSLGVAVRLLMEAFDRWHLAALLGAFESVHQYDRAAIEAEEAAVEQAAHGLEPSGGQGV